MRIWKEKITSDWDGIYLDLNLVGVWKNYSLSISKLSDNAIVEYSHGKPITIIYNFIK